MPLLGRFPKGRVEDLKLLLSQSFPQRSGAVRETVGRFESCPGGQSSAQFESLLDDPEIIVRTDAAVARPDEEETVLVVDEGELACLVPVSFLQAADHRID